MHHLQTVLLALTALLSACAMSDGPSVSRPNGGGGRGEVVVNGTSLSEAQLADLGQLYGARPLPGRWWYDPISGLYGAEGMPVAGCMYPGHQLGVPSNDASAGTSSVWVNGRRLAQVEVLHIVGMIGGPVLPGRYWLDARFNVGVEGNPFALGNLMALAQNGGGGGGGGGGDNFWSTSFSAGNSTADNSQGYVSVPGYGPVSYGM